MMRKYKILLGLILLTAFISGCQANYNSGNQIVNASSAGTTRIPVLWVYESESLYQPTFGNYTQKGFENLSKDKIQMDHSGLTFTFTTEDTSTWTEYEDVDVSIYNQKNEKIHTKQLFPEEKLYRISFEDANTLIEGESYYFDVQVTRDNVAMHYYLSFLYVVKSQNRLGISYIQEAVDSYNQTNGITLMGPQRTRIESNQKDQMDIWMEYVGAKRIEEGFEYLDVAQKYHIDFATTKIENIEDIVKEKQRYYYSKEDEGWYLGDFEESENRKFVTSSNARFKVIYNAKEAYLYDVRDEMMYEVYRLDKLNSDYIYDESGQHGIHILDVSNKGQVYFTVYGYIQDESPNYGRNGIAFYSYSLEKQPILNSLGMIENPDYYLNIEKKLNEMFYYNASQKLLYVLHEQSLYKLDFDTQEFSYVETFIKGHLNGESGLIYWDEHRDKYISNVYIVDLSGPELGYTNLFELGKYKHLIKEINGQIFVGEYKIDDTYEYLNGNVVFPYHTIKQYNQQGNLINTFRAEDYGENFYFSSIYFDDSENRYKIDLMSMRIADSNNYKNSRVHFVDIEEAIYLDIVEEEKTPIINSPIITSNPPKETSIYHAIEVSTTYKNNHDFEFREMPPLDVYIIYDHLYQEKYFASDLDDAFLQAQKRKDYTIYHWKYNATNNSGILTEIFNNHNLREQAYLEQIVTIPQRPELPRGCEVTALSILLHNYMDDAPSKMLLAYQLKTSNQTYRIEDGFVHFSDMHLEFSGSMSDTSKPGLGVYIKPIQELAEKYVSNRAKAVSGLDFEQMLGIVASGRPVLVITPNRYQEVLDHSKEVWKTPSGYMEVTYQEHSVVVMGFDENRVYYSDPSKGIIDSKPKEEFRRGWESMGSQAMIIVD